MQGDTPRTDSLVEEGGLPYDADFARKLERELAAAIKERDEAHGLIRKWRLNLVEVVGDGEYMDAMTSEARIKMDDADKRAFVAATRKEGGGA